MQSRPSSGPNPKRSLPPASCLVEVSSGVYLAGSKETNDVAFALLLTQECSPRRNYPRTAAQNSIKQMARISRNAGFGLELT
jgi:hypothetical protein